MCCKNRKIELYNTSLVIFCSSLNVTRCQQYLVLEACATFTKASLASAENILSTWLSSVQDLYLVVGLSDY